MNIIEFLKRRYRECVNTDANYILDSINKELIASITILIKINSTNKINKLMTRKLKRINRLTNQYCFLVQHYGRQDIDGKKEQIFCRLINRVNTLYLEYKDKDNYKCFKNHQYEFQLIAEWIRAGFYPTIYR